MLYVIHHRITIYPTHILFQLGVGGVCTNRKVEWVEEGGLFCFVF